MKYIILYLLLLTIIFIYGCGKEEIVEEDTLPLEEITAQVHGVDEPEIIEDVEVVEEDILTVRLCHDTDNGRVRWVNGSIFGYYNNAERFEFNDYCLDNNLLIEYYCEDENPMNRSFLCTNGCQDNHCL